MDVSQVTDTDSLRKYIRDQQLNISAQGLEKIETSIASGRYSAREVGQFLDDLAHDLRERKLSQQLDQPTQPSLSPADIRDSAGLRLYADQLNINVPEQTMQKMEQAIQKGERSPSQLANYLEGYSYEKFLQTNEVPHISEARHQSLKRELGERYTPYVEQLQSLSQKLNVSENLLDQHFSKPYLANDRSQLAIEEYSKTLPKEIPPLDSSNPRSIAQHAQALGHDIGEGKAQVYIELGYEEPELQKHILSESLSAHHKNPELFKSNIKAQEKGLDI